MQILVNKKGRTVKLTKRETDLLNDAQALLGELSASGGGDIGSESDHAAEKIGDALKAIANQGQELVAPPH